MFDHIDKLYIQAYENADYSEASKAGDRFSVLVNPESYRIRYVVDMNDTQAPGTSGVNLKFNRIRPPDISFDFLFDNTGIIRDPSPVSLAVVNPVNNNQKDVVSQVEAFKHTVLRYQGTVHSPYHLKLHWGTLTFKGKVSAMDIEFKIFNADGSPLRAVAHVQFRGSIEDNLRVAMEDRQSADITHERVFKAGDRLTLISEKIYHEPGYYLDVARQNKLNSFRKIPKGTRLFFPPLSDI